MIGLLTAISTGITAFGSTNIDDIVNLTLFFTQDNSTSRRWDVVAGQYLGLVVIVIASLPAFFSRLVFPHQWLGLLALVPIIKGIRLWLKPNKNSSEEVQTEIGRFSPLPIASFLSPQTYSVASVELAEGNDSIGIYASVFANTNLESLLVIIGVFFVLTGVWCYAAYRLVRNPVMAPVLARYGNILVPPAFIGLGVFILWDSFIA